MDLEGNKPIIILVVLISGFVVIVGGAIALSGAEPEQTQSPLSINIDGGTYEINMSQQATTIPEPTQAPVMSPTTATNETGDYPPATGQYLYDHTTNIYDIVNVSGTPTPIPANIAEARKLGWTPDLGDVDEYIYKYNLARGYLKLPPQLSLEILNDDKEPWNWQQETIAPGEIISGYYRIRNNADYPYQGDIDVYINASLFYNNGLVHMENKILTETVSITPRYYNEHWISWMVPKEISTGAYEVIIELREKEYGKVLASYRMTPLVAHVGEGGLKYF
jgi:hypothetical protein